LCDPFFKIPLDWVFSDEVESEFQGNLKAPYFRARALDSFVINHVNYSNVDM